MVSGKQKIVFFGNERLATGVTTNASTLQTLISGGYEVVAVVTNNRASVSRKDREQEVENTRQRA